MAFAGLSKLFFLGEYCINIEVSFIHKHQYRVIYISFFLAQDFTV